MLSSNYQLNSELSEQYVLFAIIIIIFWAKIYFFPKRCALNVLNVWKNNFPIFFIQLNLFAFNKKR